MQEDIKLHKRQVLPMAPLVYTEPIVMFRVIDFPGLQHSLHQASLLVSHGQLEFGFFRELLVFPAL